MTKRERELGNEGGQDGVERGKEGAEQRMEGWKQEEVRPEEGRKRNTK